MVVLALDGMGGKSSTSGYRENLYSHTPWSSSHPVSMVSLEEPNMVTVSLEKSTLKYVPQKGIPTSGLLKAGNMCLLRS